MSYKINDHERQALKGLPHLQRLLYLEALRPYMDYRTGIVGIQRGISYQSIAQELYVEPHPGYQNSGSPSKDQLRRALKGLEKAGLLKIKSEKMKMQLIVQCLLATRDNCVQNKPAIKQPQEAATKMPVSNSVFSSDFENLSEKATRDPDAEPAIPPVSGNNITTLSLAHKNKKSISMDFQPSDEIVEKALERNCPTATCPDEITQFICYHRTKNTLSCDWDAEFLRWLLRAKQYHKEQENVKQTNQHNNLQRRTGSALERAFGANQKKFVTYYE